MSDWIAEVFTEYEQEVIADYARKHSLKYHPFLVDLALAVSNLSRLRAKAYGIQIENGLSHDAFKQLLIKALK